MFKVGAGEPAQQGGSAGGEQAGGWAADGPIGGTSLNSLGVQPCWACSLAGLRPHTHSHPLDPSLFYPPPGSTTPCTASSRAP